MKNGFDIDWLKANHQMIHYFGLGFIQLKLTSEQRIHFYNSELPPIVPQEDIHNHRYDFASVILKGFLTQRIFNIVEGDDYVLEQESCKAGVEAVGEAKRCGVLLMSEHNYGENSHYRIDHRIFHQVSSNYAITMIHRGKYEKEFAEVARPVGSPKVCPFSQKIEEAQLWDIVERMLK